LQASLIGSGGAADAAGGRLGGPPLRGPRRARPTEHLGDGPASPAHPRGRDLRVLAKLVRDPPGTPPDTEPANRRRNGLLDLPGAGFV
jgi:hypothetical protein